MGTIRSTILSLSLSLVQNCSQKHKPMLACSSVGVEVNVPVPGSPSRDSGGRNQARAEVKAGSQQSVSLNLDVPGPLRRHLLTSGGAKDLLVALHWRAICSAIHQAGGLRQFWGQFCHWLGGLEAEDQVTRSLGHPPAYRTLPRCPWR